MSQEVNLSDLKKKHDEAWLKFKQFIYESYEPRFYKHKVGRKQEPITAWIDIAERIRAEEKTKALWDVWLKLYQWYWEVTGDHPHLPRVYVEKETPEGLRWVKESPEEAASYETALHTPQSQRPS